MVIGDDSCSKGRGFESRRRILDGLTFFTLICCKNCIDVCLKRPKQTKRGRGWPIFLKKVMERASYSDQQVLYLNDVVSIYFISLVERTYICP